MIKTKMEDYTEILSSINNTGKEFNDSNTIQELFEEQVKKTPRIPALKYKDAQITYDELNQMSDALAGYLRDNGVKRETIVGILTKRSIEMIVCMLAVIKAGGTFLPIDPAYPDKRILYILENSKAEMLLTFSCLADRIHFNGKIIAIDNPGLFKEGTSAVTNINNSDDVCYVIYTSGSTGLPKGVMIEHLALHNFFIGISEKIPFPEGNTILALTTITFDIFILETIFALTKGLIVIIADEDEQNNPVLLNELIVENKIDILQSTPSRMIMFLSSEQFTTGLKELKTILIGGEAFPENLLRKLKTLTCADIYNVYGPTEATIWCTARRLTDQDSIDIGTPLSNTKVHVVNENNVLALPNETGELFISGKCLARGYINNPELTREKFITDLFQKGERYYKTGDLARYDESGKLFILGRKDNQIKLRGHRIELDEIETVLAKCDAVKEAALIFKNSEETGGNIYAFITGDAKIDTAGVENYLAKHLPSYMIPAAIIQIPQMPASFNGKIDRKSLHKLIVDGISKNEDPAVTTEENNTAEKIKSILIGVEGLRVPCNVTKGSTLKEWGVTSMLFMKVIITIETAFNMEFDLSKLSMDKFPDIYSLAKYIDDNS